MKSQNNENNIIRTVLSFSKRDKHLCNWIKSVPRSRFSFYVKEAIRAYLSNDTNFRLPKFNVSEEEVKNTVYKSFSIGKNDPEIYEFFTSIKKQDRSYEIAKILKMYLRDKDITINSNNTINNNSKILNIPNNIKSINKAKNKKPSKQDIEKVNNLVASFLK